MDRSQKIQAFESWLQSTGTAEQKALFDKTLVQGIVIVAGSRAVTKSHVEASALLASESGAPEPIVQNILKLGALLVRFEDSPTSRADAVSVASVAMPKHEESSAPGADVAPIVAPRPSAPPPRPSAPALAAAPVRPSGPMPAMAPEYDLPPALMFLVKYKRAALAAAAGLGVAVVAFAVWFELRDRSSGPPVALPAPLPVKTAPARPRPPALIYRLDEIDLAVHFPEGWRRAPPPADTAPGAAASSVSLFRGETEARAEQRAFIAVLEHSNALEDGGVAPAPDDASLLSWTQAAEEGAAATFASDAGTYSSTGCDVSLIGTTRTGRCVGVAPSADGAMIVETFLRFGPKRAALAVFLAPGNLENTGSQAVVATLRP